MAAVLVSTHTGFILDRFLCPLRELYPHAALGPLLKDCSLLAQSVKCYIRSLHRFASAETFWLHSIPASGRRWKRQATDFVRQTVWLKIRYWYLSTKFKIVNYIWPDLSVDRSAKKMFESWWADNVELHWTRFPERANRWHIQSFVVTLE